jgi:hypothetical protein
MFRSPEALFRVMIGFGEMEERKDQPKKLSLFDFLISERPEKTPKTNYWLMIS